MCSVVGNEGRCIHDMIEHQLEIILYEKYIYYQSKVDRMYVST